MSRLLRSTSGGLPVSVSHEPSPPLHLCWVKSLQGGGQSLEAVVRVAATPLQAAVEVAAAAGKPLLTGVWVAAAAAAGARLCQRNTGAVTACHQPRVRS
jgi:hypothetical protein